MEMDTKTELNDENEELELAFEFNELPPIPPSSDPQRLLMYVLNIVPKYTEMETMTSHLRLYTTGLEQDLDILKKHVTTLTRNVAQEEERKLFLERYAAQVVKERNDLLHGKQGSKHRTPGGTNVHFVWHTCCKKNNHHVMDVNPSMATLRGEKLHECRADVQQLQLQLAHFEKLQNELRVSLRHTQREADSKLEAQRKHTQNLEKQILQRSILQSNLERKLYQTEKTLSNFESDKRSEKERFEKKLETLTLEKDVTQQRVNALDHGLCVTIKERDEALEKLRKSQKTVKQLTDELDAQSLKHTAALGEVEALHSELDLIQSKDLEQVRAEYKSVIVKLREEKTSRETELLQAIDKLQKELIVLQNSKKDKGQEETLENAAIQLSNQDHPIPVKTSSVVQKSAADESSIMENVTEEEDALWRSGASNSEMLGLFRAYDVEAPSSNHSVESQINFVNWESFISEQRSCDGDGSCRLASEASQEITKQDEVESVASSASPMKESSNGEQIRESNTRRSLFVSSGSMSSSMEEKEDKEGRNNDDITARESDSEDAFVLDDLQAIVVKFKQRCDVEQKKAQVLEQELLELQQTDSFNKAIH